MVEEQQIEWTVLGRVIGTATGWDQADSFVISVYDFQPVAGVNLPKTDCLTVDFEKGTAETYDEKGEVTSSTDLVTALKNIKVEA